MSIEEEKAKSPEQEQDQEHLKDSKLSSKDDSINKKMQEMYAQHKKEVQTNQRPQSKYHRDRVQSGKKEEKEQNQEEPKEIDENALLQKINEHFEKRQITKKEFSDNQNVFLPLDEFFELFKNIHLDLKDEEINYLFNNKNPNKNDGYIYFNTFLDNYDFKFYPGESTLINKSNTDNQSNHSNYTSLLLTKQEKIITPAVQNEFNLFKNDILNIVEESKNPHAKNQLPPLKKEHPQKSGSRRTSQNNTSARKDEKKIPLLEKEVSKTQTKESNTTKRKPQSAMKINNYSKTGAIPTEKKKHKVNYLKQTLQRMQLEEEMIRLTIDKRDKEFQRDCVKKMVLANEYAEKLNIPKSYSAYSEEGENTIICRVFSKTVKDFKDINLKQFLIEFKKLEKLINQQNEREKYKDNVNKEMYERKEREEDFFKMDRNDKHKIIKKILKESIQLKLQLKKQLKALRDKKLIDLDTLNKNLKLTNLDDDTIL